MYEASKALMRRLYDSRYATRYFVGHGIDIGCGPDPVSQYGQQFPLMKSCRRLTAHSTSCTPATAWSTWWIRGWRWAIGCACSSPAGT
jgi:hypothetical protein